jgi:serine/alanine adding enzyme
MTSTSTGTAALVEVPPDDWDALLARLGCPDAYLLRGYLESACLLEANDLDHKQGLELPRPVFLHLADGGGAVVFAVILREIEGSEGRLDAITPYGYGGPVGVGAEPPVESFYGLYEDWCDSNGVVSTFIRFHPLFANRRQAPPGLHVERLADTIAWSLDRELDLFTKMHPKHRNKVRKARGAGFEVAVREAPESLSEFAALYEETMSRLGATDFYFFPDAYWRTLESSLREQLVLVEARGGGELAAAAFCFATPPWLHYHVSGTSERGREAAAANLVLFEAACWGQSRGFEQFHLGGGAGGREDTLFHFKQRFFPDGRREASVGKLVHDPETYRSLAGESELRLDGYFPAYRRPAEPES